MISYRDYKNFSQLRFRIELDQQLSRSDIVNILKTKYVRANDGPFMTKD